MGGCKIDSQQEAAKGPKTMNFAACFDRTRVRYHAVLMASLILGGCVGDGGGPVPSHETSTLRARNNASVAEPAAVEEAHATGEGLVNSNAAQVNAFFAPRQPSGTPTFGFSRRSAPSVFRVNERPGPASSQGLVSEILATRQIAGLSLGTKWNSDGNWEPLKLSTCQNLDRVGFVRRGSGGDIHVQTYKGIIRKITQWGRKQNVDPGYGSDVFEVSARFQDFPNKLAAAYGEPKRRIYSIDGGRSVRYRSEIIRSSHVDRVHMNYSLSATPNEPADIHVMAYVADDSIAFTLQDSRVVNAAEKTISECDRNGGSAVLGALVAAVAQKLLTCDGKPCPASTPSSTSRSGSGTTYGCSAQAGGMSSIYGYSKGHSSRGEAEARAIQECISRGGRGCRITSCGYAR